MSKTNYRISEGALVVELERLGGKLVKGWKLSCQTPTALGAPGCDWVEYHVEYLDSSWLKCPNCPRSACAIVECHRARWVVLGGPA